jgi:hypothetical protein
VKSVMPPARVLVIEALGTIAASDVTRAGFNVIARPASIGDIVTAVSSLIQPEA